MLIQDFGLENKPGHLNCFLNVVLQSLWHLKPMREFLLRFNGTEFSPFNGSVAFPPLTQPFLEALKVLISLY